jgi:FtsZ-binding cell division protein ZapB
MLKIYALIIILGILGGVGYSAKYYYDTTQATIATLRENNAQLEVAVQTATESIETLQADAAKISKLNTQLQSDLQKAEAYTDELRGKLSRMNLVVEALKDAAVLEGKMNGATAKLWRNFMEDTGNTEQYPLPEWLRREDSGAGDQSSNEDREDANTNSVETETTPAS